jgi:hypothetical protein
MTKKKLDSEKEKSWEIFFCQDSKNRKYGLSKKLKSQEARKSKLCRNISQFFLVAVIPK